MLLLRFWIKDGSKRVYIETEVEDYNYKDGKNIYLKNGSIPRKMILGEIEEVWVDEETV